jgi:hypothetical protein
MERLGKRFESFATGAPYPVTCGGLHGTLTFRAGHFDASSRLESQDYQTQWYQALCVV